MFIDKESFDAMIEQQKREIHNMKVIKKHERDRAIEIIKSFPIERYLGFKCTSCDDFSSFINDWIDDMVKEIKDTKRNLIKTDNLTAHDSTNSVPQKVVYKFPPKTTKSSSKNKFILDKPTAQNE